MKKVVIEMHLCPMLERKKLRNEKRKRETRKDEEDGYGSEGKDAFLSPLTLLGDERGLFFF